MKRKTFRLSLSLAFLLPSAVKAGLLSSISKVFLSSALLFNTGTSQTCFQDRAELKSAVDDYLGNDTFASSTYGSPIDTWCVGSVTNMSELFKDKTTFNEDLSSWNVSSVTTMSYMFRYAEAFNQPLSNWNVSSVTDMSYMFYYAEVFNQPLNDWDVSSVTDMGYMFYSADAFNQPLNSWDVSSVTDMRYMFSYADSFNQPLNNWDVSSVTSMPWMFRHAEAFNQPLNSWDVSSVTNMRYMFYFAKAFNQPLDNWDVSRVTDMFYMFNYARAFNQPLNSWNVSSVTDMRCMFGYARSFNQPLDSWDVSSVTDMSYMFYWADVFNQPLNSWDVSSVTDMSYMFYSAYAFNQPLNSWDVSSMTDMSYMFFFANDFNQDLCAWGKKLDASANVYRMFWYSGCPSTGIPDLINHPPDPFCVVVCPTFSPSSSPTQPTSPPTLSPTYYPTSPPTLSPSLSPTSLTSSPTQPPTRIPTPSPTLLSKKETLWVSSSSGVVGFCIISGIIFCILSRRKGTPCYLCVKKYKNNRAQRTRLQSEHNLSELEMGIKPSSDDKKRRKELLSLIQEAEERFKAKLNLSLEEKEKLAHKIHLYLENVALGEEKLIESIIGSRLYHTTLHQGEGTTSSFNALDKINREQRISSAHRSDFKLTSVQKFCLNAIAEKRKQRPTYHVSEEEKALFSRIFSQKATLYPEAEPTKKRKERLIKRITDIEIQLQYDGHFPKKEKEELYNLIDVYLGTSQEKKDKLIVSLLTPHAPKVKTNLLVFLRSNPTYLAQKNISIVRKWGIACVAYFEEGSLAIDNQEEIAYLDLPQRELKHLEEIAKPKVEEEFPVNAPCEEDLKEEEKEEEQPLRPKREVDTKSHLICPISSELMTEAVFTPQGTSYQKEAIEKWIKRNHTDPMDRSPLQIADLTPNRQLRKMVEDYIQAHGNDALYMD